MALKGALHGHGLDVFVDTQMQVGVRWVEEIEQQLESAQFFIVLLSKDSVRSDMVRREIRLAHHLALAGRLAILPVRVAFEGTLPFDLGAYLDPLQYALWQKSTPFEPVCQQIAAAILKRESLPERAKETDSEGLRMLAAATEHRGAPLPVADPRLETGTLDPSSPFYIKRPEDARIEAFVERGGDTAVIKAPRQFGKSSLMARAISLAAHAGWKTCLVDFQQFDDGQMVDLDHLCRFLAYKLARELRASIKPADVWDDHLGPKESLRIFIEDAILAETRVPILLCLDEADRIFDRDYRGDFFTAVRGWHNSRATEPLWKHLKLLIVHSTDPSLWIQDLNTSPFNVGERLRLEAFASEHLEELNHRHGGPLTLTSEIDRLLQLLGGQPYLTRQAFFVLATGDDSLDELERDADQDRGPFGDHLRQRMASLRRDPRRMRALKQILRSGRCDDELDFERLAAAGLVLGENRRSVTLACELYTRYFKKHL